MYYNNASGKDSNYDGVNNKFAAIANVANNFVDNQFDLVKDLLFGTTKAKIARENEKSRVQNALGALSNQQKYVLDLKLQSATTEREKQKIFAETLTALSGQKFEVGQKSTYQMAFIGIGGAVLLFTVIFLYKKKD